MWCLNLSAKLADSEESSILYLNFMLCKYFTIIINFTLVFAYMLITRVKKKKKREKKKKKTAKAYTLDTASHS